MTNERISSDKKYTARAVAGKEPAYDVIPIVRTPNIDPGESIDIGIYVSGYGDVDRSKVSIFHSQPQILDKENPGELKHNIVGGLDKSSNEIQTLFTGDVIIEEGLDPTLELTQSGVTLSLSPIHFADDPGWGPPRGHSHYAKNETYPRILSETTFNSRSPVEITYFTSDQASPGDYEIHAVLTYGNGEQTQQSKESVSVHINNRRERWEPVPTIAIILAALIALFSLMYDTGIFSYIFEGWTEIFANIF